jgi:hypothetical protein
MPESGSNFLLVEAVVSDLEVHSISGTGLLSPGVYQHYRSQQ